MITASHNPAQYNGMKFTRAAARSDLARYRAFADSRSQSRSGNLPPAASGPASSTAARHSRRVRRALPLLHRPYRRSSRLRSRSTPATVWPAKPFRTSSSSCRAKSFRSTSNSTATFPNHPASPIEPENMVDLQAAVRRARLRPRRRVRRRRRPDVHRRREGRADRREHRHRAGRAQHAQEASRREDSLQLDLQPQRARARSREAGGIPIRSKVGHSIIKQAMREQDIVFGGEHTGHFYFNDNWYADSGMIALMQCLELFSEAGKPVSEVIAPIDTRFRSGEINSQVKDAPAKLEELENALQRCADRPSRRHNDLLSTLVDERAPFEHRAAVAPQRRRRHARS